MNKYNAHKTTYDGMWFDSKKECERYKQLKVMERAGEISELRCQVRFQLLPKTMEEKAVTYVTDFTYVENGQQVAEDVKSSRKTLRPEYIIKRKLFKYMYYPDWEFREVFDV